MLRVLLIYWIKFIIYLLLLYPWKINASIYQKTPKGYVNISTNILNTEEDRLLGDLILNSSDIHSEGSCTIY